jgi:hypothetical protein
MKEEDYYKADTLPLDYINSHEGYMEINYYCLKRDWMDSFDKYGAYGTGGYNGAVSLAKIILYYESLDTVEGYLRCSVMWKLAIEYRQKFPHRYG